MEPYLLDFPPEAGQVGEFHAWIIIHDDGREAMVSADLPIPGGGVRHGPLMSSRRDLAEKLGPVADWIRREMTNRSGQTFRLELRTYRAVAGDDGCCHKTRVAGAPCPLGRKCPFIKEPDV